MSQGSTSADEARSHEQLLTSVLTACEQQQLAAGLHLLYHYRAVAKFKQGKHSAAVQDARTALSIQARQVTGLVALSEQPWVSSLHAQHPPPADAHACMLPSVQLHAG